MNRSEDVADMLGLITCMAQGGNERAAALLQYVTDLERRIGDMHTIIAELRAERDDEEQKVQAYKRQCADMNKAMHEVAA